MHVILRKLEDGERLTGEIRAKWAAELRQLYEQGVSTADLGEMIGRPSSYAYRLLCDAGTRMRVGRPSVSGADREELAAQLRERYDAGSSHRQIAEDIGKSASFVRGLLVRAGTAMRPCHPVKPVNGYQFFNDARLADTLC